MTRAASFPHGDPDRVVREILAQSPYRDALATTNVEPKASAWQTAWNWIWDHVLGPLLQPLVKALAASQGVGTVVGFVLVGLALLVLAAIAFRLALAFARPERRGPRVPAGAAIDVARTSADWKRTARDAAARADFGEAIAALFSAALAALDERDVVAFDAARTPGEYRRFVRRARDAAAPPFDELADRFVRAAYAPEASGAAEYEAAQRAYAAFEPVVAR